LRGVESDYMGRSIARLAGPLAILMATACSEPAPAVIDYEPPSEDPVRMVMLPELEVEPQFDMDFTDALDDPDFVIPEKAQRMSLLGIIVTAMKRNEIPLDTLHYHLAIFKGESNFDPRCVSWAGASGFGQQMPFQEKSFKNILPTLDELVVYNPVVEKDGRRMNDLRYVQRRRRHRKAYARELSKLLGSQTELNQDTLRVLAYWRDEGKISPQDYRQAEQLAHDMYWQDLSNRHSFFNNYTASLIATKKLYDQALRFGRSRCYTYKGRRHCTGGFNELDAWSLSAAVYHSGPGGVAKIMTEHQPRTVAQYIKASPKLHAGYIMRFRKRQAVFRRMLAEGNLDHEHVSKAFGRDCARNLFKRYLIKIY